MDGKCYESGRVLMFHWRIKDLPDKCAIMTETIEFMGLKAFRFALKRYATNRNRLTILYLIGINLHKLGIKVAKVYLKFKGRMEDSTHMKPSINEVDHLQMFTKEINFKLKEEETVCFGVHVVETINNYRFHLFDRLWVDQLWEAAKNKQFTDLEFAVKNNTFSAHRAILASRSPTFATIHIDVLNSRVKIENVEPASFYSFLRFVYKGIFRLKLGASIEEVLHLAEKYNVETLKILCESASQEIDANQLTAFAMAIKPDFEILMKKPLAENKGKPKTILVLRKHYTVIECVWNVDALPDKNQVYTSELLHFRHDGAFRAGLADHSTLKTSTLLSPEHFLYLACSHLEKTGTALHQVDSYVDGNDYCLMERRGDKALSFFGRELYALNVPCEFKFDILMKETIENYRYELIDSLCAPNLWSAFENAVLTDVELIVGDSTFPAHRIVIGARSPFFANLLSSSTVESVTGRIKIEDANPEIFRQFLYFLYTGSIQISANSRSLLKLAEKYEVETLAELCRSATQELDIEEISTSLIWL